MSKESLFKRLAKNAEAMGKAGLIDNAYLDAKNTDIEKIMREYAGYDQLQLDWYKKKLAEESAKLWENNSPKLNTSEEAIKGMLADGGHFKTQYESKRSEGMLNPSLRNRAENNMFGTKMTTADRRSPTNFEKNPVYGWQRSRVWDDDGRRSTDRYGDNLVTLQPNVKDRMTYSIGDSLDEGEISGRYGFSDWSALMSDHGLKGYLENQDEGIAFYEQELKRYATYLEAARKSGNPEAIANMQKLYDEQLKKIENLRDAKSIHVNSAMYDAFDKIRKMNDPKLTATNYIENQYHGGLTGKDIESAKNYLGGDWDLKNANENTDLVVAPLDLEKLYLEYGIDPASDGAFEELENIVLDKQKKYLFVDKNKVPE